VQETGRNPSDRFFRIKMTIIQLKFVKLEAPGNEDSEYVFKIFVSYLWRKRQRKMFDQFIKSLCDEINGS
jgi:hypothetical protein